MAITLSLRFLPLLALALPVVAQGDSVMPGLTGFEKFHDPVGQPIYFETPFNDTGLRFLYLKHELPEGLNGDVTVYAMQARVALNERWAFIATKDGYSDVQIGALGIDETGWNDIAFGFKYVAIADRANDFVLTPGIRYMMEAGDDEVLQSTTQEFSPFVSAAKGFGAMHLVGNATLRLPTDGDKGNTVGHWDLHLDYDINPGEKWVFAPVAEVHGVHYLDDGAVALGVGGLDYANLGSQPAEHFVAWAGLGMRCEISNKYELGLVYEFALTDADDDIMDKRVTFDFGVRF